VYNRPQQKAGESTLTSVDAQRKQFFCTDFATYWSELRADAIPHPPLLRTV
jgi:hypothetical protein